MKPQVIPLLTIGRAIQVGWNNFLDAKEISLIYSLIFALIGTAILVVLHYGETIPMALPFAGGFMLVGPILLVGYFGIADALAAGQTVSAKRIIASFARVHKGFWVVSLVCMLLFMIWITDAAILYGFIVGRVPVPLHALFPTSGDVNTFFFWCSVMGCVLGLIIFAVSAFSVPLLYEQRVSLVAAISASVQAVLSNFWVTMVWAVLITLLTMAAIFFIPLFPLVFPVLAFASYDLYRAVFPLTSYGDGQ